MIVDQASAIGQELFLLSLPFFLVVCVRDLAQGHGSDRDLHGDLVEAGFRSDAEPVDDQFQRLRPRTGKLTLEVSFRLAARLALDDRLIDLVEGEAVGQAELVVESRGLDRNVVTWAGAQLLVLRFVEVEDFGRGDADLVEPVFALVINTS